MACISCQKRAELAAAKQAEKARQSVVSNTAFGALASAPDLYASIKSIPEIGVNEPVIQNWRYRPPAGGWAVELSVSGAKMRFNSPPATMVGEISRAYNAVGRQVPTSKIWDYLNMVWSQRDPNRVVRKQQKAVDEAKADPNAHLEVSPSTFGPRLWGMMSLFGIKGQFDKGAWESTIAYVTKVLDPALSPGGCDECHETFTLYRLNHDPALVSDEHQAAWWVWNLHNEVNKKLGRAIMPFEQAVRIHQWAFEIVETQAKPI